MYNRTPVPPEFVTPDGPACGSYHLRTSPINDGAGEVDAVMATLERLAGLIDLQRSSLISRTKEEDLIDLAWHRREFRLRHLSVDAAMTLDDCQRLGRVYVSPSNTPAIDAVAFPGRSVSWADWSNLQQEP